ncbi:MAG: ester cyclase [Jiangellaceae bacterium]|jgi:hypothetical protein
MIEEVFNEHDPDAARRFFARDYVEHVPAPEQGQGVEGMQRFLAETVFPAFPDMHWSVEEQIAEGDRVLTRFTWRGTHQGTFAGIPPTNRQVEVWGMVLDRVNDGKLIESRILMDNLGMLQQMGVIPAPGQPPPA